MERMLNIPGGQTDVILLDFSRAFDKVYTPYKTLWKACILWYSWTIINLDNKFSYQQNCMIFNGQSSQMSNVLSGVPQGTVLGPLLLLCYINNLPNNVTSRVKLYADDVLLYTPVNTIVDCQSLQEDLDRLVQWADRWQMNFNFTKRGITNSSILNKQ